MDGRPATTLTIKEAAQHFGVSERTIRRRIADGKLVASRVPIKQGYEVYVHLDTAPDNLDTAPDNLDTPTVNEPLLKALELVEQLQRENVQLAGQVGFLQAKLQDAQDRINALEAPKEPEPTPEPEPAAEQQPAPQPSEARSPLWEWIRRRLRRT